MAKKVTTDLDAKKPAATPATGAMPKSTTPKAAMAAKITTPSPAPAVDAPPAAAKAKSTKPRATPVVPSATTEVATQPLMVTDEMIAERAYHKWRNGEPGDHHHHWVTSERELRDNG